MRGGGSRNRGSGKWRGGAAGRRAGGGEIGGRSVVKGEAEWCPCPRATRSVRSRSLARQQQQQHHHKTSLSSGNFSGIVTVNNVHLTFSVPLARIVDLPSDRSLSFNHKADRRRTRFTWELRSARRRGCTLTVPLFAIQMRDD